MDIEDEEGTGMATANQDVYENFIPIKKPIKLTELDGYIVTQNREEEPFKEEYLVCNICFNI